MLNSDPWIVLSLINSSLNITLNYNLCLWLQSVVIAFKEYQFPCLLKEELFYLPSNYLILARLGSPVWPKIWCLLAGDICDWLGVFPTGLEHIHVWYSCSIHCLLESRDRGSGATFQSPQPSAPFMVDCKPENMRVWGQKKQIFYLLCGPRVTWPIQL